MPLPVLNVTAAVTISILAVFSPASIDPPEGDAPRPLVPVSVSVVGAPIARLGKTVRVEELVDAAKSVGQDIVPQLMGKGAPVAVESALQGERSSVRTAELVRTATTPYARLRVWRDNKYMQVVLRQGTSAWGWAHARDKHHVTQTMIRKATQFPRSRTVQGTNIYYVTPAIKYTCWLAFCSIDKQMDVKVVYENKKETDMFAKGVITTYCVAKPVTCPQWVRDVAG